MYLIYEWLNVKHIPCSNPLDIGKRQAFPIPFYDEKSFPFVFVLGEQYISLLNTTTLEYKPLTSGMTASGAGLAQFAFALGD